MIKYYLFDVKKLKKIMVTNFYNKNYKRITSGNIIKKSNIILNTMVFSFKSGFIIYKYPQIKFTNQCYIYIYNITKKYLNFILSIFDACFMYIYIGSKEIFHSFIKVFYNYFCNLLTTEHFENRRKSVMLTFFINFLGKKYYYLHCL